MNADVLVVGAGPTGLMMAAQLARRGLQPTIIDRHSGPAQQTRAMAVHARTIEIYAKLGIAERALALGRTASGANMWANGRRTARIPIGEIGRDMSPFPFILMLGQDDNERILGEKLNALGVRVQWNTELVGIEQRDDAVMATVKEPNGTRRIIAARYVAGCDGARSAVRDFSGITFPGEPYEHVFFVADTEAVGAMVADELNVYLWRDGFHLFFPMRGSDRWRVIGILPERLRGREDLGFEDVMPALRHEAGIDLDFRACDWFSTYRIHHRAASRFRDRRCFLLGDAAHIHSPMGGQGMNTGLQDAYNLAWKLAHVLEGRADAALLDTYESERVPVAQRLLITTDRAFRIVVSSTWLAGVFRTQIMARMAAAAMTIERVRKLAFRTISQIGIRYPGSALSQTLAGVPKQAPRAGDRFPWLRLVLVAEGPPEDLYERLDDLHFHLLVIRQEAAPAQALARYAFLRVHGIPAHPENAAALARAGIEASAFYLLRPDGHVGVAGTRLDPDAIARYLDRYFAADVSSRTRARASAPS